MAWTEPLKNGHRGRYRNPANPREKVPVLQPDGTPFPRKRDALHAANEEEARARRSAKTRRGASIQLASITWGDWWDQLAEKRDFPSDTRRKEDQIVAKHLRPKWGDTPLSDLTKKRVQKWIDEEELRVRPGMSPGYVGRIYGVFRLSINAAVAEEILDASPCSGISLPKVAKDVDKPYLDVPTAKAVNLHPRFAAAVEFGLETGLRPGELAGLHASTVHLDAGYLVVKHVLVSRRKMIRDYPKDGDTRRVPLTPRAAELVRAALADRDLHAGCGLEHFSGKPCDSALVWLPPRQAKVLVPDVLGTAMRRAAAAAKLPRRSPYAIRRGFGTRAARGGADAFELAGWMGHSDPRLTHEYVQETPDALQRLSAALSPTAGPSGAPTGADARPQALSDNSSGAQPHAP